MNPPLLRRGAQPFLPARLVTGQLGPGCFRGFELLSPAHEDLLHHGWMNDINHLFEDHQFKQHE